MALAREVVIVDYLRSPFSRSKPKDPEKDLFNCWRMDQLAAMLMNTLIKRTRINSEEIDECIVGVGNPVLETFTMGGRFPILLANCLRKSQHNKSIQRAGLLLMESGLQP